MKLPHCKNWYELDRLVRTYGWDVHRTFHTIHRINRFEEGCTEKQAQAATLSWWNCTSDEYHILHICLASVLLSELKKHIKKQKVNA
jgi:hypothetical protein